MMFLEWQNLVKIKIDGFMQQVLNNKKQKAILIKGLEKQYSVMILVKLMNKLVNPGFLFGINLKGKL